MGILQYRTIGNGTAQEKQKIYYCAHPKDYNEYFDKCFDVIFPILTTNSALYYLPSLLLKSRKIDRDEDFFFRLKEMNLFIMIVTKRLLTTKNPAFDIEFQFAIKNNIPVIPLMVETGLETIFSEKCGDIKFFDFTCDTWDNWIKLKESINTVLGNDELVEKIRKEFDAKIFLSYRKKDKKVAQQLMHAIHDIDFCRDIAIWYDEFLTIGESYNNSISKEIENCDLFIMAITPSVIEKSQDKYGNLCENYIVSTEYPLAKASKKIILPVELVDTDKAELSSKFPDIPKCINNYDILVDSLSKVLNEKVLRANDNDPEHNYLIGLAYLNGIGVEKNRDLAIQLFVTAADAKHPDATKKLFSIYKTEEFEKAEYDKAKIWQCRLQILKKQIYDEKQDEFSAQEYLLELSNYASYLYEKRENSKLNDKDKEVYLNDAEKAYTALLEESLKIKDKFKSEWPLPYIVTGYHSLAQIHENRSDLTKAEIFYLNAIKYQINYMEKTNSFDDIDYDDSKYERDRTLGSYYNNMGHFYLNQNNLSKAKEYFMKSFELLGVYNTWLGEMLYSNEDYNGAADFYILLIKLEGVDNNPKELKNILKQLKKLAKQSKSSYDFSELASKYEKIGETYKNHFNNKKARIYYYKSLRIRRKTTGQYLGILNSTVNANSNNQLSPEGIKQVIDLCKCYLLLAETFANSKMKLYYSFATNILDQLTNIIIPDSENKEKTYRLLADLYFTLAETFYWYNDTDESNKKAILYYSKSLEYRLFLKDNEGSIELRNLLASNYHILACHLGNKEFHEKALDISLTIYNETHTASSRDFLHIIYDSMGDFYNSQKEYDVAEEYYLKAIKLEEELDYYSDQTIESYKKLAFNSQENGDIATAIDYYLKSINAAEKIIEQTFTNYNISDQDERNRFIAERFNLETLYERLANLDKCKRIEYLQKALYYLKLKQNHLYKSPYRASCIKEIEKSLRYASQSD